MDITHPESGRHECPPADGGHSHYAHRRAAMKKVSIWTLATGLFLLLLALDREAGLLAGCLLILGLGLAIDRKKLWAWPVAAAISWTYIYLNRHSYGGYNLYRISFLGVSVLPILAWPSLLMLFYFWIAPLFRERNGWRLWGQLSVTLAGMIIAMEVLGYHVFDLQLNSGRVHAGWPVLDIFHCPWWMTACYFWNGTLFCGIISAAAARERSRRRAAAPG